jgi:hypothetical protein
VENKNKAPGLRRIGDPRDILVASLELEREDVMKLKPIIETIYWFFIEEGYSHPQSGDDRIEDLYWERWTPSGAKEQHIWWRLQKRVNKYIRYYFEVNFQTLNVTKAEIAYNEKKVSGEKIDLIIRVKCWLQWDYNNLFEESWVMRMKKTFFNKMYKEEIEQKKSDLESFAAKLDRAIKGWMDMDHTQPPTFFPRMGYQQP